MDLFALVDNASDGQLLELRDQIVRRIREVSLPLGVVVFVLVEGDDHMWLTRIADAYEGDDLPGPEVEVFAATEWPSMFLAAESAREALAAGGGGQRLAVRTGAQGYVLMPG